MVPTTTTIVNSSKTRSFKVIFSLNILRIVQKYIKFESIFRHVKNLLFKISILVRTLNNTISFQFNEFRRTDTFQLRIWIRHLTIINSIRFSSIYQPIAVKFCSKNQTKFFTGVDRFLKIWFFTRIV